MTKYVKVTAILPVQDSYVPGTWANNETTKNMIESHILNGMSDSLYDDDCEIDISFVETDDETINASAKPTNTPSNHKNAAQSLESIKG